MKDIDELLVQLREADALMAERIPLKYCTFALEAIDKAIVILRKQKPVKLRAEKAMLDYQSWHYVCGDCEKPIDIQDNFCRHCGRPIEHT